MHSTSSFVYRTTATTTATLLQHRLQSVEFLSLQHLVDVQQDLYFAFAFGHAEDVGRRNAIPEVRCVFDLARGYIHRFGNPVHDDTRQRHTAVRPLDLHHNDAGALRVFDLRQAEL